MNGPLDLKFFKDLDKNKVKMFNTMINNIMWGKILSNLSVVLKQHLKLLPALVISKAKMLKPNNFTLSGLSLRYIIIMGSEFFDPPIKDLIEC